MTSCRRPTARFAVADPHQPLRVFICSIKGEIFMICAKNSGVAWGVVMDRYGVTHPGALPTPRHLHTVPMVRAPDSDDMLTTRQCDLRAMAQATGGKR